MANSVTQLESWLNYFHPRLRSDQTINFNLHPATHRLVVPLDKPDVAYRYSVRLFFLYRDIQAEHTGKRPTNADVGVRCRICCDVQAGVRLEVFGSS